jgi:hypothetical protein
MFQRNWSGIISGAIVATTLAAQAQATPIGYSGSQGSLSASALFENVGGNLRVTLTNTSGADVLNPSSILAAVFFDIGGASPPVLTPASAILGSGSTVLFGGTDPGGVVGGEWAFASNLSGAPGGALWGISSTGLGLFGAANFPGTNLQGPLSVGGVQYGITSFGDNPAIGNAAVTGGNALIKYQVVFELSGLPAGFDPSARISDVQFQYGTALTDARFPEPATGGLMLIMGIMIASRTPRRSRR